MAGVRILLNMEVQHECISRARAKKRQAHPRGFAQEIHVSLRARIESMNMGAECLPWTDVIKIHYTGFLEDGSEFENTREKEPLELRVGSGRVVPGIETAVS